MPRIIRQSALADFYRKARQCIASPFGARPALARLGAFAALPAEMMLEIIKHLDEVSQVSFALTCREFFSHYRPEKALLQSMATLPRQQLLVLLEKDIPGLLYCFHCDKLHRWRRKPWPHGGPTAFRYPNPRWFECEDYSRWTGPPGLSLPYIVGRLVMNRHFLGRKHGRDLTALRGRCNDFARCRTSHSWAWQARVFGDELVMKCTMTWHNKRGDTQALRRYVDNMFMCLCDHLAYNAPSYPPKPPQKAANLWPGYGRSIKTPIDELGEGHDTKACFVACQPRTRSCPQCMTDFRVDIQNKRRWVGGGWVIKVESCYSLGSLRSPEEWEWEMLSQPYKQDRVLEPRISKNPAEYGPGIVWEKWCAVDGVIVPSGADWVQLWAP